MKRQQDNCIAVYDFLRAMSFVACIIFQCLLFRSLKTIHFKCQVDWNQILLLIVVSAVAYLFYMGFLKYYRKFTLENFMCLLCDEAFNFPDYAKKERGNITEVNTENNTETITIK